MATVVHEQLLHATCLLDKWRHSKRARHVKDATQHNQKVDVVCRDSVKCDSLRHDCRELDPHHLDRQEFQCVRSGVNCQVVARTFWKKLPRLQPAHVHVHVHHSIRDRHTHCMVETKLHEAERQDTPVDKECPEPHACDCDRGMLGLLV